MNQMNTIGVGSGIGEGDGNGDGLGGGLGDGEGSGGVGEGVALAVLDPLQAMSTKAAATMPSNRRMAGSLEIAL